jgi:hypothetical protein
LIVDIEQRIAALEAEVARLTSRVFPPRAAPLPVEMAIERVTVDYVHKGSRHSLRHHKGVCVYVLSEGATVTYVGRSTVGFGARFDDHEGKAFDRVAVYDLTIGSGRRALTAFHALEAALIQHYQVPRFNIAIETGIGPTAALWPLHNAAVWARVTSPGAPCAKATP